MGAASLMSLAIRKLSVSSKWLRPFVCLLAVCAGCTSIESTMVTRDESNQNWERHNCLNGIPITLKVPTHLKLYVYQKYYLEKVKDKDGLDTLAPADVDVMVRDFAHE